MRCGAVWRYVVQACFHAGVLYLTIMCTIMSTLCRRSGVGAVRAWIHHVRDYVRELARARVRVNVCVRVGVA